MSTLSAGLIQAENLTVTGTQSGAVTATNLNVGTGTFTVGGKLSVEKIITPHGHLDVSGNLNVTGTIIENYIGYPPLDVESSWEGVWDLHDAYNENYYVGNIAIVKETNNTYTLYTNATGDYSGAGQVNFEDNNNDHQYYFQKYKLLASGVRPFYQVVDGSNVLQNAIPIPKGYAEKDTFDQTDPTTYVLVSRRLTMDDIGSNASFYAGLSINNQCYMFSMMYRVLLPTDVTPEGDWFSAYQGTYNATRIKKNTLLDVFDDVDGTYEATRQHVLQGYNLSKTIKDVITGETYPVFPNTP
jgi:hypothetical protein